MTHQYQCNCGETESLQVVVSVWADLDQSDPDNHETSTCGSDIEWELDSPMRCKSCGWNNPAGNFAVISDQVRTGSELRERYAICHPKVPFGEWRTAVYRNETELGYWDWAAERIPFIVQGMTAHL